MLAQKENKWQAPDPDLDLNADLWFEESRPELDKIVRICIIAY
jgi:hypothetical protein